MRIVKKNKLLYYAAAYSRLWLPKPSLADTLQYLENRLTAEELASAEKRVAYYNKLSTRTPIEQQGTTIADLRRPQSPKTYYHDTYEFARYFPAEQRIDYRFGDLIEVPSTPSIVKSRPIAGNNVNSVLLNLDKNRHFVWIDGDIPFDQKKDTLIGRFFVTQPHRIRFFEQYFGHPRCDLGQINTQGGKPEWIKQKISLAEHLRYKFILSLEGNDVATNLKWIMSSNSVAVMPRPKYETWFMEGTLQPGVHYIEIADDFSNLESQLEYYQHQPDECKAIIRKANEYTAQFRNPLLEKYISLKVLEKYFELT